MNGHGNQLKSDIIVVDKLLETASIANYSKNTYRIKNVHMQNMSLLLLLYITHMVTYKCRSNSIVTITANKMDANNKTIDCKSTGSDG